MFHTLGALKNRVAQDAAELEQQIRVDIERRTMATADRIVAATEVDRAHMLEAYAASARKIVVVPGGVNLEMFAPGDRQAARRAAGAGSGADAAVRRAHPATQGHRHSDSGGGRAAREVGPLRVLVVGGTGDALAGRSQRRLARWPVCGRR